MFTFILYDDNVTLYFHNEIMEFECSPENCTSLLEDGYSGDTCNGEFSFSYDDKMINFYFAKHGDGCGGRFSLSLNMTKEIKESLDNAMKEWRDYLKKREIEENM